MSGKGDAPRPLSVDRRTFDDNWARVFGPKRPVPKADDPKQEDGNA
jgi:hypothetical protein